MHFIRFGHVGSPPWSLLSKNYFNLSEPCDLDLYLKILKLDMTNPNINFHNTKSKHSPVIIWKWLHCLGPLWPWPLTIWAQNQYGSSAVRTNLPINLYDPVNKHSPVIIRKWFHCLGPLWPWPLTLWAKIIRGQLLVMTTQISTFMILCQSILQLSSENGFTVSGPCDLDLWPYELKINRDHLPVRTNLPINFHDPGTKRSPVIIWK